MGRGFYVLDNVNPLRNADASRRAKDAYLFAPVPAIRSAGGATIQYLLKHPVQSIKIEVIDTTGRVVRSFLGGTAAPPPDTTGGGRGGRGRRRARRLWRRLSASTAAGIQNVTWDLALSERGRLSGT